MIQYSNKLGMLFEKLVASPLVLIAKALNQVSASKSSGHSLVPYFIWFSSLQRRQAISNDTAELCADRLIYFAIRGIFDANG